MDEGSPSFGIVIEPFETRRTLQSILTRKKPSRPSPPHPIPADNEKQWNQNAHILYQGAQDPAGGPFPFAAPTTWVTNTSLPQSIPVFGFVPGFTTAQVRPSVGMGGGGGGQVAVQ
jgi:hypothetical protein